MDCAVEIAVSGSWSVPRLAQVAACNGREINPNKESEETALSLITFFQNCGLYYVLLKTQPNSCIRQQLAIICNLEIACYE